MGVMHQADAPGRQPLTLEGGGESDIEEDRELRCKQQAGGVKELEASHTLIS